MVKVQVNSQGKAYMTTSGKVLLSSGSSPVISSLNITPTTSAQTITAPSGTDGYSPVNVAAVTAAIDNNIVSSNIVSGVSILGVNGKAVVRNGQTKFADLTESTTLPTTIFPDSNYNCLNNLTIESVENLEASNIKDGVTILGVTGSVIELNGETINITPTTSQQVITPTSPKNGITQATVAAVTSSIDSNITASNIKKDVTILGVTGSYEGSGGSGKYQLLQRISDDNGDEIGTVSGFFTDTNDVEYAVVCLDAQYRLASADWFSNNTTTVTDLPIYGSTQWGPWEAKETATYNTQKILDFCTAGGYTSTACSHCRTLSFTIDGVTYYGQLPNMIELNDIVRNHIALNTADTTASSYSSVNFSTGRNRWSSSQYSESFAWGASTNGSMNNSYKTDTYSVVPVLEIPNS